MSTYSLSNTTDHEHSQLTSETILVLNKYLTKTCRQILVSLYNSPRMQQKDLSSTINTTASSLSNLIGKIEAISPQLLTAEKSGRAKYYSLTPVARTYVRDELLKNEPSKIRSFSSTSYSDELFEKTLYCLKEIQNKAGSNWDIALDGLLTGHEESPSSLTYYFDNFIDNLKKMKICHSESSLNKIYELLNNSILIKRIDLYLADSLKDFYRLSPLFELESNSKEPWAAFKLIDDIFSNISGDNERIRPNSSYVEIETYYDLYNTILHMIKDASAHCYSKEEALKHWESLYCSQNNSLYYIAEKYVNYSVR